MRFRSGSYIVTSCDEEGIMEACRELLVTSSAFASTYFEIGSHYVVQTGLKLVILLPHKCWDYKKLLLSLIFFFFLVCIQSNGFHLSPFLTNLSLYFVLIPSLLCPPLSSTIKNKTKQPPPPKIRQNKNY